MFNINETKNFMDSVHGYIAIPKCFVDNLIDTEYFQRLRNIEQTGMRVLYPAAKHDRFSHSLGVFHLGQKGVDSLLENFSREKYWSVSQKEDTDEAAKETKLFWMKNKILFLIACLLHDIGHAPFSHSLEKHILDNSKIKETIKTGRKSTTSTMSITEKLKALIETCERDYYSQAGKDYDTLEGEIIIKAAPHEQIGAYVILSGEFQLRIKTLIAEINAKKLIGQDLIDGDDNYEILFEDDDLCFIARMIMGIKYKDWDHKRQLRNCFIELLNGENFDVDKLDYIVRDTQMSGINNVTVDVDRLLSSLCIIAKTKHFDKESLNGKIIKNISATIIKNKETSSRLKIKGHLSGKIIFEKGTIVTIYPNSQFKSFKGKMTEMAKIAYKTADQAVFSASSFLRTDDGEQKVTETEDFQGEDVKTLQGKGAEKTFEAYIQKAEVKKKFSFIVKEDAEIFLLGPCEILIEGKFYADDTIKMFEITELEGGISEIEILEDSLQSDYTVIKNPSEKGYNVFSIGFKKQAINVVANVLDARNYLYLWVYAHHKVIYYANFLIPVIAQKLSKIIKNTATKEFPHLSLNYDNLKNLDDCYIWSAIKYLLDKESWTKNKKEKVYYELIMQLLTRKYHKSLYKSLAEFELFFEEFNLEDKQKLVLKLKQIMGRVKLLELSSNEREEVGYFSEAELKKLNEALNCGTLKVEELVCVFAKYKMKQIKTKEVYINMGDEIVTISQIPLLEVQSSKPLESQDNQYFYLYYKTNRNELTKEEFEAVKIAVKKYFRSIITVKRREKIHS